MSFLLDAIQDHAKQNLAINLAQPRVAVVTYRDITWIDKSESHAKVLMDFTSDVQSVAEKLDTVQCIGNTDFPEDPISALKLAEGLDWTRKPNRSRVALLFTDAPQHGQEWKPATDIWKHPINDNFPDWNSSRDTVEDTLHALAKKKISLSFVCMRSDQTNAYMSLTMAQKWKEICSGFAVKKDVNIFRCGEMTPQSFLKQCVRAVTVSLTDPKFGTASTMRAATVSKSVSEGKAHAADADAVMSKAAAHRKRFTTLDALAEKDEADAALVEHDPSASAEEKAAAAARARAAAEVAAHASKSIAATARMESTATRAAVQGAALDMSRIDAASSALEENASMLEKALNKSAYDI